MAIKFSDSPRNSELEAAIRVDRDDPGPYQVYADWLQLQGSPLGELLILAQSEGGVAIERTNAIHRYVSVHE